jgi:thermostable 8-oxoguanine DNA glycosylase
MKAVHRSADKVRITKAFVDHWSAQYDEKYPAGSKVHEDEQCLKKWLAEQSGPKSLDKERFLKLAGWKSERPKPRYERNSSAFVREVTELAFQASDDRLRMHILMALDGVGMPVASALLHFAFPDRYPILDFHVVRTLRRAGLWRRGEAPDFTPAEWLEFTQLMRRLASRLGVHMRDLDKALWAFDKKLPPKPEEG